MARAGRYKNNPPSGKWWYNPYGHREMISTMIISISNSLQIEKERKKMMSLFHHWTFLINMMGSDISLRHLMLRNFICVVDVILFSFFCFVCLFKEGTF